MIRRLFSIGNFQSTDGVIALIKKEKCVFRYVQFAKGWGLEEKNLYKIFINVFGDSPVCNHLKAHSRPMIKKTKKNKLRKLH